MVEPMTVSIPCTEEQRLIADFLSDFDVAIAATKRELELWKELKKGLLQQMFV
jgi:type I restriction enzyme S subunit